MLLVSLALFIYHASLLAWLLYGARELSRLKGTDNEISEPNLPSLTIVVPARNEENTLATGLNSLCQLTYPQLCICVVNDRSTDKTGLILKDFERRDPRIRSISVECLPPDWLGKNYALHLGAQDSESELILFTDADVEIDDEFLKQAVGFFLRHRLDHLAGIPRVVTSQVLLYPLLGAFGLAFSLFTRPWQGKDPKTDQAVGIGAFNLVRRSSYQAFGGHAPLRLRPDDDLKLALLLKRAGYRTDCITAVEGLRVEWYSRFEDLKRGLEKNVMTGFEYSFPKAILGNVLFALTFLLPFLMPWLTSGLSWLFCMGAVMCLLLAYLGQLYEARMPLLCTPSFPIAALGILYIFSRACWLTYRNQGVYWRDTFYPLKTLRTNRIPPPDRV